ncbi:MAG: type IV toxin-antitoxin system AbiEi family antitoxin [Candidatus Bathyarchaeia archaeon]
MVRNPFVGKSSHIIRVLISNPQNKWTTRQLAAEAKVSLGLTSIITNDLIDMGFLIRERSMKLKLRREEELMKRWAAAYNSGMQKSKAYYSPGTLYEIGTRISEIAKKYPIKYAFTGSFATDLATQYIRPAEIRAYLSTENDMEKVVSGLNLEIAEIGGNIIFLVPEDEFVFYGARDVTDSRVGSVTIVSDLQLILDLYNDTDRTREAAQRLLTRKYESKMRLDKTIEMVKEFFTTQGLVADRILSAGDHLEPDFIFRSPSTKELIAVELKTSTAKLDSVDSLKRAVLNLGPTSKGILVAPSITDAAKKELEKANLQFEPLEEIENGVHKTAS